MRRQACRVALAGLLASSCAHQVRPVKAPVAAAAPGAAPKQKEQADASEDIAVQRQKGRTQLFSWQPWSRESFAAAKAAGKLILLDGAAEWCHWCHVMDETTYLDPEVGALLRDRFVAVRIDVDQNPDVAARYEDWGWPATVIFSPEGAELGKFRGYLPPERMREILGDALKAPRGAQQSKPNATDRVGALPVPAGALSWVAARVLYDLDARYDEDQGGWGAGGKKSPIGANLEVELLRAQGGDEAARKRARFTLDQQRALIDPVWGGIYQYSVRGGWDRPHFEKLMPLQAANLEAYARAITVLHGEDDRRDAQAIARYLDGFLRNKEGEYLVSQDADVGAHDRGGRFVDGNEYYRKDDAGRRALGMPRIDDHVYARENGLAIAALCALYEAEHEPQVLERAITTAERMLKTHVDADGGVRREARIEGPPPVRYLVDAAALGRGFARLYQVSGQARWRDAAVRVGKALLRDFGDEAGGGLWASTPDPAASGVFALASRARPFDHDVLGARFLLLLGKITGEGSYKKRALRVLAAAATPAALQDQGRMSGEFLLAAAEAGAISLQ